MEMSNINKLEKYLKGNIDEGKATLMEVLTPDILKTWREQPPTIRIETVNKCNASCLFCHGEGTPILMADLTYKPIQDIKIGDLVIGLEKKQYNKHRLWSYVISEVTDIHSRESEVVSLIMEDRTTVCTPDHKWAERYHGYRETRLFRIDQSIKGVSPPSWFDDNTDFKLGWLCGISVGDGTIRERDYRLAVKDQEILNRFENYSAYVGIDGIKRNANWYVPDNPNHSTLGAISLFRKKQVRKISDIMLKDPLKESLDFQKGYLSGIFDAEGSYSQYLKISNRDINVLDRIVRIGNNIGLEFVRDKLGARLRGGQAAIIHFFNVCNPSAGRKREYLIGLAQQGYVKIKGIIKHDSPQTVYNITTTTGNYIASGLFSKNCGYPHMKRKKKAMSKNLFTNIIDDCAEWQPKKIKPYLHGELFCDPNWKDRLTYIDDNLTGDIHIETNASLLDEDATEFLMDIKHLRTIGFNVSGPTPDKYPEVMGLDYYTVRDNIIKFIDTVKRRRKLLELYTIMVADADYHTIADGQYYRKTWGPLARTNMCFNYGGVLRPRHILHGECQGLKEMCILSSGKVALCWFDLEGSEILGDANKEDLLDIWNSDRAIEIRTLHREGRRGEIDICNRCNFA